MVRTVKGLAFVLGAMAMGVLGAPRDAGAQLVTRVPLILGTQIAIECKNPGSHQDVAKTPILKNTTAAALKKGQTLSWKSSDGDKGSLKLQADLAPGATVSAIGQPGNAYSCTSAFVSAADLAVKSAYINSNSQAVVTVANLDSWVDAGPQVVRFEVVSCSTNAVLASVDSTEFSVAKGQTKSITMPIGSASGKRYIRAKADATLKVAEFNEQNNVLAQMDSCVY